MTRSTPAALDFDRPEVRLRAVLLMLGAAVLSPNIYLPGDLPAVRLEQVLLLIFALPFAGYAARHPEARQIRMVDVAFVTLGIAILLSIVLAPVFVPAAGRSWHDVFALVRPLEYWLLYRMAMTCVPSEGSSLLTLIVLFVVSVVAGLFALVQVLAPASFNQVVAAIWATSHNLEGLLNARRVVGTGSSAPVFAMMVCLFSLAAFWTFLLTRQLPRRVTAAAAAGMAAGILGLLLAVSRGVIIAAVVGFLFGAVLVFASRRPTRWRVALSLLTLCIAGSAAVLILLPPAVKGAPSPGATAGSRFDIGTIGTDPSVVLRLERLKLLFANSGEPSGTAGLCAGSTVVQASADHVPAAADGEAPSIDPATGELADERRRDAQRKRDVGAIAAALNRSYCATGSWPTGDAAQALAAVGLPSIPRDPQTGASYVGFLGPKGYEVSATLEDPGDPDGPVFLAANEANIVSNPSFEEGASVPTDWQTDQATEVALSSTAPKFGSKAADVTLAPQGFLYGYVVYTLAPSTDYSASIWMRSMTGTPQPVRFYLTAILADGTRITPAAFVTPTLPADGSWLRARLPFHSPSRGLVYAVQLVVQPWPTTGQASITVDGATFNATSEPPAFALTRDVDPATLRSTVPSWLESPLVGLGPLNVLQVGGDPGEYVLMLIHFGVVGLVAYLLLFGTTAWLLFGVWRRSSGYQAILALTALTGTAVGAVFAVTSASYASYQLMAIYWLLVGLVLAEPASNRVAGRLPRPSLPSRAEAAESLPPA